jgi:hypothetical protein
MFAAIVPILSLIGQSVKDYFVHRQEMTRENRELELASIKATKDAIVSGNEADTAQRQAYLNATSRRFRQGIFYWFSAIIAYSILFPSKAESLWANFELIPEWVRYAYIGMISVAWGLPVAKENIGLMFSAVGRGIAARREYKLEKAKINRQSLFDVIKARWFPRGMNKQQVKDLDDAIDAGEQ